MKRLRRERASRQERERDRESYIRERKKNKEKKGATDSEGERLEHKDRKKERRGG